MIFLYIANVDLHSRIRCADELAYGFDTYWGPSTQNPWPEPYIFDPDPLNLESVGECGLGFNGTNSGDGFGGEEL